MFKGDEHTVREITQDHVGRYFTKYVPENGGKPFMVEGILGINSDGTYIAQQEDPETREKKHTGRAGQVTGFLWQPIEHDPTFAYKERSPHSNEDEIS